MDFELNNQHLLARATAREFARRELAPYAQHWDETMTFPAAAVKKLAQLGFMGISIPREYGGCGLDSVSYVLIIEELAKACASTAIIVSVHNSVCAYPIYLLGTESQKRDYLVPLSRGELLGGFALTEPNAGSDPASLETTAHLQNGSYRVSGTKTFITSGSTADVLIVMARTDRTRRSRGITAFIVERAFGGIKAGSKENKLGIRASDTCELIFEQCPVPAANVLGEPGAGLGAALDTLVFGRVGVGAQALGVAQCAFEESVRYSRQRKQFGRPIADFEAVQWMLADMATEIEAARCLVYRAALLKDRNKPFAAEASMAKLYASETAMRCATKAVQLHGGYGCMKDYRVERCFRDAKVIEIYEGTSEIQRLIIARNIVR